MNAEAIFIIFQGAQSFISGQFSKNSERTKEKLEDLGRPSKWSGKQFVAAQYVGILTGWNTGMRMAKLAVVMAFPMGL